MAGVTFNTFNTIKERHVGEFTGMQFRFMNFGNRNNILSVRQVQDKILVKVNQLLWEVM